MNDLLRRARVYSTALTAIAAGKHLDSCPLHYMEPCDCAKTMAGRAIEMADWLVTAERWEKAGLDGPDVAAVDGTDEK